MTDTVIIIGAGVAGLAAGCYAQMNGYRSQIFELHDLSGGLCTAWERIYGRKLYDTEQIQVCDQVIDFLETRYPGIGGDV